MMIDGVAAGINCWANETKNVPDDGDALMTWAVNLDFAYACRGDCQSRAPSGLACIFGIDQSSHFGRKRVVVLQRAATSVTLSAKRDLRILLRPPTRLEH